MIDEYSENINSNIEESIDNLDEMIDIELESNGSVKSDNSNDLITLIQINNGSAQQHFSLQNTALNQSYVNILHYFNILWI